ncbi:S41 family peptidase [Sphingomonas sp. AP4-R1]|nr:S41 family peptidase [Sphingomonas sp. AP4-R1]
MLVRSVVLLSVLAASPAWAQRPAPVTVAPSAAPADLTPGQRSAAIDDIIQKVSARYVFPDRVPTIVARLNQARASGRYATGSPADFAARVSEDLREASNDRHMYLTYAPEQFAAASAGKGGGEDSPQLQAFWEREAHRDNHGLTEMKILSGNVRYLRVAGFEWVEDQTGAAYDAAMRFLRSGDAVIIDLRGNGGGSHAAVRYLLSHFMDGDKLDITFLEAGKDPIQSRTLEYLPAGRLKGKPLYVLISNRVGSGAEAFAYDVQQFHLGTLVGATTSGAANNNELSPIAPGFMLSCSYGRPVHPVSQSNWEGFGVAPDVATEPEQALDVAHSLALAELLKRTDANPADRAEWIWASPAVEARLHPPVLSQSRMRALAGQYGDQRVLWRDGALHYVRRNGQAARLIPLTDDALFTVEGLDDRLHIRLSADAMELQWNDDPAPARLPKTRN